MILSPSPKQQFFNNNGRPLDGGLLFTYAAGTNTKIATYQDEAGTPNTNPIVLDFRGEANIWLDPELTYKYVLSPKGDTDPPTSPIWTEDNIAGGVTVSTLTQQFLGQIIYPRTAAEIAAGVTPVFYIYPPGNLLRYGADASGLNDSTGAINDAILAAVQNTGTGYVYHPGGTIKHASPITVPNDITIYGVNRDYCTFSYAGDDSKSAWHNINPPNGGGTANVSFSGLTFITAAGSTSTAAAIELNAGGLSFYSVRNCRITGGFKWGIIIDACEISDFEDNDIQVSGPADSANIWLVNGADRNAGQLTRFTNNISIRRNNIRGGYGILDDGGSNHWIEDNNLDSLIVPIVLADVTEFRVDGNEIEAGLGTGDANIRFATIGFYSGAAKGPCVAGRIQDNFIGAAMAAASACIKFGGADFHQSISISGNGFTGPTGAASDIDCTKLGSSFAGFNQSFLGPGLSHYSGVIADSNGNTLLPPQNGFLGVNTPSVYGNNDTRFAYVFAGGINVSRTPNSLQLDSQRWQDFTLEIINSAGTLQHAIYASGGNAIASSYVDRVSGASTTLTNTPTVGPVTNFATGVGINGSSIVFNTAAQTAALVNVAAKIVFYDGNATSCNVLGAVVSRNVNGSTLNRIELSLSNDMTGAAVNVNTTLLPAGKSIWIQVTGFVA